MSDRMNESYIAIARACLKAINTAAEQEDRASQIQHVYHAIEEAFQEQTRPLEQRIDSLTQALETIASDELEPDEMVARARTALESDKDSDKPSPLH